jgi:hypothetical protein
VMQYLKTAYQTVSQQAVMSALNRDESWTKKGRGQMASIDLSDAEGTNLLAEPLRSKGYNPIKNRT